ncbi:aspartate kinase [Nonlabens ulvanivorans]|uniref:aspartate kinase n=1 Tax=Nonlabens ulvanivorans TaxID=906888 RepID=UPI0037C57C75
MNIIHIYLFGLGNVGSTLIKQILESQHFFKINQSVELKIVGLANSRKVLTVADGIGEDWEQVFVEQSVTRQPDAFYEFAMTNDEVRIAVDATASKELSRFYPELVEQGFHVVTANKIANTLSQEFYDDLRLLLKERELSFEYETNVGAGLPIVDTIRNLHKSGEEIFAVNGVFSGSLGYIFNRFSQEEVPFSQIVLEALKQGYTEPDPREDLSGNDVARKLLVLARESGLKVEFSDIIIENLVVTDLQTASANQFIDRITELDKPLQHHKSRLQPDEVLRHLGKLDVVNKSLEVSLQVVKKDSPAGQLQGSDGFFEIYSESYAAHPLVIKGAGAGKAVTARGLLSDIIKIAKSCPVVTYK